jgi:hypothetical protein
LAASGPNSPTSVILATTSLSSIPLGYCNSVDYVVYGHSRSSVWKSTLCEHFSLDPSTKMLGQLAIWSPDSQHCLHGYTEYLAQRAEAWEQIQALVDVSELTRTTPQISEDSRSPLAGRQDSNVAPLVSNTPPARATHSVSLPLDDDEEGMVPLSSLYLGDLRHRASPISGVQYNAAAAGNTPAVESAAMVGFIVVSSENKLTGYRLSGHQSPRQIHFPHQRPLSFPPSLPRMCLRINLSFRLLSKSAIGSRTRW